MDGCLFLEAIKAPYVPTTYDEHLFLWCLATDKELMAPSLLFFPTPFFLPNSCWGRGRLDKVMRDRG
jgi:hypothetical protein